eukprot:TRINITY_DN15211_c0_g1_i2.p1 TRINITY_DN15211_c0_g1~~TRINITY_DN15211_c0_g1_i2.p1  ORF type:complete len:475 (+),score=122.53 TRINITY_DN15211_c0_g1_i2:119-1543(+)
MLRSLVGSEMCIRDRCTQQLQEARDEIGRLKRVPAFEQEQQRRADLETRRAQFAQSALLDAAKEEARKKALEAAWGEDAKELANLAQLPSVPGLGGEQAGEGSEERECMACYCVSANMYTVPCTGRHEFCVDCITEHVRRMLSVDKRIANCPLCEHEISHTEIKQLFPHEPQLYETQLEIRLMNTLVQESNGFVACPTPGCKQYLAVELDQGKVQARVECPSCLNVFCSACKNTYHAHLGCDAIAPATERWYQWLRVGREDYFQEQTQRAFDQEVVAAMKRFEQLQADEQWKESNCRLCPHCARTCFKVDGCDSMTCGRDAADKGGGNQQDGCGKTFTWTRAKPYQRGVDHAHLPKSVDDVDGATVLQQKHHFLGPTNELMRADTTPFRIKCSGCNQDIVGPLFQCINCVGWSCCLECEPFISEIHDPGHVFSVHFEDYGTTLPAWPGTPGAPPAATYEFDPGDFEEFAEVVNL